MAGIGVNCLRARYSGFISIQLDDAVLAGPLTLEQGAVGLICRMPVWIKIEGVPRLWGAVSITKQVDDLMREADRAMYRAKREKIPE